MSPHEWTDVMPSFESQRKKIQEVADNCFFEMIRNNMHWLNYLWVERKVNLFIFSCVDVHQEGGKWLGWIFETFTILNREVCLAIKNTFTRTPGRTGYGRTQARTALRYCSNCSQNTGHISGAKRSANCNGSRNSSTTSSDSPNITSIWKICQVCWILQSVWFSHCQVAHVHNFHAGPFPKKVFHVHCRIHHAEENKQPFHHLSCKNKQNEQTNKIFCARRREENSFFLIIPVHFFRSQNMMLLLLIAIVAALIEVS